MEDEEDLIERKTDSAKSRSPSIGESLYASTILSIEVCHVFSMFTINIDIYSQSRRRIRDGTAH